MTRQRCWTPLGPACVLADRKTGAVLTGTFLSLAMDPRDPDGRTVYAGAAEGGVWKSADEGITWSPVGDKLPTTAVGVLAAGAVDEGTLLIAGTGDSRPGQGLPGRGVTVSWSGGGVWENLQFPTELTLEPPIMRAAAMDPDDGTRRMWLATEVGLFWRRTRATESWHPVLNQLAKPMLRRWTSVVVTSNRVLAGVGEGNSPQTQDGLYFTSLDDADPKTMERIAGTPDLLPPLGSTGEIALAVAPSNRSIVYALFTSPGSILIGLFRSSDGGETWHQRAVPAGGAPNRPFMVVSPANPDHVYIGLGPLLIQSRDGGAANESWTRVSGFKGQAFALAFSPVTPFHAWLATTEGIYFSAEEALPPPAPQPPTSPPDDELPEEDLEDPDPLPRPPHWQLRNRGLAAVPMMGIAQHPTERSILLGAGGNLGALRYRNHPLWERKLDVPIFRVAIDPNEPSTWYATTNFFGSEGFRGPHQSRDSGDTWHAIDRGLTILDRADVTPLIVDPSRKGIVYFGTDSVYRWDEAHRELGWVQIATTAVTTGSGDDTATERTPLTALAVAPSDSNVLYAGTINGEVHRIAFDASTGIWTKSPAVKLPGTHKGDGVSSLAVSFKDPKVVFATIGFPALPFRSQSKLKIDRRLKKSVDGGATWSDVDLFSFILDSVFFHKILLHPDDENRAFLGTDRGVFAASFSPTANDQMWREFTDNLPHGPVADLLLFPAGPADPNASTPPERFLRAAVFGRGVWERLLDQEPELPCGGSEVYLRDNILDTGDGPTALEARDPASNTSDRLITPTEARDLKVDRRDPDDEYETFKGNRDYLHNSNPGAIPDFVGFELFRRESVPANQETHVFLQIHNRGPDTETVRARVLFAREGSESTPLPANPLGTIAPTEAWQPVGDWQEVEVRPADPTVVAWKDWVPPRDLKGKVLMVGFVVPVLVNAALPGADVKEIARTNSRVVFRSSKVIPVPDGGWFRWWMVPVAVGGAITVVATIAYGDDVYRYFRGLLGSGGKEPEDRK